MKIVDKLNNCKIPGWAMVGIFNSDYSGMSEEDIKILDDWIDFVEKQIYDPHFFRYYNNPCQLHQLDSSF